jgi:uncharacterized protein YcnI
MRAAVALGGVLLGLAFPAVAEAHVELSPDSVEPGSFTVFTVLSPNEAETPLTGLRLTVPDGLEVEGIADTPGFTGEAVRDQRDRVVGLSWQGGEVAPEHVGLFRFTASVPSDTTTIHMTGVQSFDDGSTKVWHSPQIEVASERSSDRVARGLAIAAAVVALAALAVALRGERRRPR